MPELTTDEKCRAIIEAIRDLCNKEEREDEDAVISFSRDWGGNSLTVEVKGQGHTHVGGPGEHYSFATLVDSLHGVLCEGRGLTFV